MKDKCNAFDVELAKQFLKFKDDLEDNERIRECYRHTNRVLNSPYSSTLAKKLMNYYVKKIKENPNDLEKCVENLSSSCNYIIAHA